MNTDPSAELLNQLRDIQAAPPVPWWPPAPGWWLVAALTLILLGILGRLLQRRWKRRLARRHALDRLAGLRAQVDPQSQPQAYLAEVNRLLKIIAMRAFPEESCGHLQGEAWARFLTGKLGAGAAADGLLVLANGPYQPVPEFDDQALERSARDWISRHG